MNDQELADRDFEKDDPDAAAKGIALAFLLSAIFYGAIALAIIKFSGGS